MIIQHGIPLTLRSREKVSVTFLGKTFNAQPADGEWRLALDPVPSGGPFSMDIESAEKDKITINDIYAGDVWLCAGQSNMELQMERLCDVYPEEWTDDFPLIRQYKVPQEWDFSSPRDDVTGGCWTAASKETLYEFSAAAWFFAKNMYNKYRIPIGLVNTAWGGTPVESWMSKEALSAFPGKAAIGEQYADAAKCRETTDKNQAEIQEWESRIAKEDKGLSVWHEQHLDVSLWDEISLPGDFADAGLSGFCGSIWLARDFDRHDAFSGCYAELGTITDADTVFINSVQIGSTGYRYPPRKYAIADGLLKPGKNRITIRVVCNNGEGGVTREKPFRISSDSAVTELAGTWKYKTGVTVTQNRPKDFFFQWQPMGPYNAMIAPTLNYPLKGVIWYQGESNDSNPAEYSKLIKAMIHDWRKKSGNESLSFLFVQLPVYGNPTENDENASWAVLRESQKAALSLPAVGMATALDLGEWNDLHPVNKKDIGLRLFLAADKLLFNADNSSPGPLLSHFERKGNKLTLSFDNCTEGLRGKTNVSVLADKKYSHLPVEIDGKDRISVDLSSVSNPEKIFYAWANNPKHRQLYNSEGLPVIPFMLEIKG
ncbi:MAG: sialate O-acetylesterase [Treponema sp.]|nr:sialate O-acetylesterase [Treponema sp.]